MLGNERSDFIGQNPLNKDEHLITMALNMLNYFVNLTKKILIKRYHVFKLKSNMSYIYL